MFILLETCLMLISKTCQLNPKFIASRSIEKQIKYMTTSYSQLRYKECTWWIYIVGSTWWIYIVGIPKLQLLLLEPFRNQQQQLNIQQSLKGIAARPCKDLGAHMAENGVVGWSLKIDHTVSRFPTAMRSVGNRRFLLEWHIT